MKDDSLKSNGAEKPSAQYSDMLTNNKSVPRIRKSHNKVAEYRNLFLEETVRIENGTQYTLNDIIGESESIKNAVNKARLIATKNVPVLLRGETGTGKELFAQGIHNASTVKKGAFVSINCAAIPENLVESYLFGTVKGAYTGAIDKPGLLEEANGGTLFLDELNSLPWFTQGKLLRVLQEKEASRVGSTKMYQVNCRIISATNQSPEKLIEDNLLRSDLYYRLAVLNISIPPLRDRYGDVDFLTSYFIKSYNAKYELQLQGVDPDVRQILNEYSWRGNVRELKNTIEHMICFIAVDQRRLSVKDLPDYLLQRNQPNPQYNPESSHYQGSLSQMIEDFRRDIILESLNRHQWNVSQTAKELDAKRENIYYFIKKYGLSRPQ